MRRSPWVRSLLIDGATLTSWLVVVALVVVTESGLWMGMRRTLRTVSVSLEAKEQWFGIYYQAQKVGFTHLLLMPAERGGTPGFLVTDRGRLRFSLLGTPQTVEIQAQAFIDADYRLRTFLASIEAEQYHLRLQGQREGDELVLTLTSPASSVRQRLRGPIEQLWVNGLSSWAAFHRLQVGQRGRAWILNPLALKPEPVYFYVRRRETLNGQDALVVETDYRGLTATTWITPEGLVLKESSPMGWQLVQEPMREAMAVPGRDAAPIDLLSTVAVTVDRSIPDPAGLRSLTVLVEGAGAGEFRVDRRPWQESLPPEQLSTFGQAPPGGAWCLLKLTRPSWQPDATVTLRPAKRHTAPSVFVQSDDPVIGRKARELIGAITDPRQQAEALHQWVYASLSKRLTIGLPSAKDVLVTQAGDCHEHTVLFTALARSLGIPTRMVAGLVSYRDRFYYHAWPEVWHGGWIPMDPTLGQVLADATHLGLVEAEGEELVSLARFVGQIRLRVLELE